MPTDAQQYNMKNHIGICILLVIDEKLVLLKSNLIYFPSYTLDVKRNQWEYSCRTYILNGSESRKCRQE